MTRKLIPGPDLRNSRTQSFYCYTLNRNSMTSPSCTAFDAEFAGFAGFGAGAEKLTGGPL
jgi:hypothetical protein